MAYTSDQIKKEYALECDGQRADNLVYLREKIAKKSQKDFREELGFTSSDMSNIESGKKNLSLYHIHAYKKYFKENHGLDVSTDFIMGYSRIVQNKSMNLTSEFGFDEDTINKLKNMQEKYRFLLNRLIQTDAIDNVLRSISIYCYSPFQKLKLVYDGVSSTELPREDLWEFNMLNSYKEFCNALNNLRSDEKIFDAVARRWETDSFNAFLEATSKAQSCMGQSVKNSLEKLLEIYKQDENPDKARIEILEKRIHEEQKSTI